MSKAKVGVSMLYCLAEPFNRMVKRLGTMDTKYIEILDDGTHDLDKNRRERLLEAIGKLADAPTTPHGARLSPLQATSQASGAIVSVMTGWCGNPRSSKRTAGRAKTRRTP